ncbi:MAG: hypothetical protein GVY04_11945 [Cyanobacteria bacterium]|nr:hypothetical protein [Cyanobacteria bacterium GSL.Bin1]
MQTASIRDGGVAFSRVTQTITKQINPILFLLEVYILLSLCGWLSVYNILGAIAIEVIGLSLTFRPRSNQT